MRALAIATAAVALATPALAQEAKWNVPAQPFRILGDTYFVGSEGLGMYLIATPAGLIVIDSGTQQTAAMVERNIATLGFKLKDVKYLLVSHAHYDHVGGMAKLKADTGAVLVTTEGERYALEKGVYPGAESRHDFDFPPVKVDRIVADGGTITLGGVTVTAHITPGHTSGCTSWSWPVKDGAVTHTALNFCSASVAYNTLVPPQYPGIVADYRKTFATARSIPGDIILGPHTEFFDLWAKKARIAPGQPSPYIDRPAYLALVATQEAAFKRALAEQEAKAK